MLNAGVSAFPVQRGACSLCFAFRETAAPASVRLLADAGRGGSAP